MAVSTVRPLPWAVALFLWLCLAVVDAQIYSFDNEPIPGGKTLHTLYAVYVYSKEDSPTGISVDPYVKFTGVSLKEEPGTTASDRLKSYEGVQTGLLWIPTFWNDLDLTRLCSTSADVTQGRAKHANQLMLFQDKNATAGVGRTAYAYTVKYGTPQDIQYPITETGAYILMISNCDDLNDGVMSGSVVVRNSYGFLPGSEFHKMPFYGLLFFIYAALATMWVALCLKWRSQLFHIHYCVAVIIAMGLVEAGLWWSFYKDWNVTGVLGKPFFAVAIFSSVVKATFSYMLVLVASLGWGVTRPHLERSTILKVQALTVTYIIMDSIQECVLAFQRSHLLSLTFALLCMLPVAVLNGIIFYWIFSALSSLMTTLRENKQQDKLQLFERLWWVLTMALVCSCTVLVVQLIDLSRDFNIRWKYQWVFEDGVKHVVFLFVFVAMMYLWKPNANSQRYAYSQQIEGEDVGEDYDDSSFRGGPQKGQVTPTKLGNDAIVGV